ncbi:hypothetical protein [Thalassobacillus hwangdonensis]|uniref:DUF3899 domain-containing protein n=1 Tax=Thalassobacillus hwangdonensis TaxID=546108 RepID=A0ABW3KZ49_9BACI
MKKLLVVLITIVAETIALAIVSYITGWNLMDILFLGSIVIFGIVWLFYLSTHQSGNVMNAGIRGTTGFNGGEIKPFSFALTPVTIGMVVFIAGSLVVTLIHYASYF